MLLSNILSAYHFYLDRLSVLVSMYRSEKDIALRLSQNQKGVIQIMITLSELDGMNHLQSFFSQSASMSNSLFLFSCSSFSFSVFHPYLPQKLVFRSKWVSLFISPSLLFKPNSLLVSSLSLFLTLTLDLTPLAL
jgi:hypothetical protein